MDHFCNLSNSSSKQIRLFLSNKEKAYSTFKIPKKNGGLREINAPSKKMKNIQRWILNNILYKLNAGNLAHGFIPDRSILTNASIHVGQDLVLGIDIKDYFPSISFRSVYYIFKSAGYTKKIAWSLSDLCTYHWKLPQGAPTSPMLANLSTVDLDYEIDNYCTRRNFRYSRYADDITISGSYKLPMHKQKIIEIIERNGFVINEEKTRVLSRGSQQKVTGLVVNDKVSIGRRKKKILRAIVHNIQKNGAETENREKDPFFKEKICGELAFAKMVDPDFANPLIEKLKGFNWLSYDENLKNSRDSELIVRSLEKKHYFHPVDANNIIESESDFLKAIATTITELKHYIEDRRWTEPFWDEAREVEMDGKKYKIPAVPKKESKIQPTIHIFFCRNLLPFGIHVLRETDEGIGKLDFKFLVTIKGNIPVNVCAEFKLAHNEELEHGLTKQLPLYLKASPSKSGLFLVMWFKDEKEEYFKRPTNQNKTQMLKYLEETIKKINECGKFKIESVLIDASKRPSASHS
ncbi:MULTISPECIES: retron St85 family RNA-directed DNA polymerase [unclassified Methanosarcina]|uniref:retron St85 family RNA-directed DNA polymerase n=1 Tax=unclassified Methanosarcina TaxID=2644672 RepID=UPI002100A0AC|nr:MULTISPECIES: retron St85 family RNA-directed DNA polymerase [unclassified Methanosarcina]